jgi:dipeptidyl aminopeptidase/acylaminoacyl peptidase
MLNSMKRLLFVVTALFATAALAQKPQTFTLKQALSAPYATDLTGAPVGKLFAWVEDEEGRHNLYVGGENTLAHALTHNTDDDAQDISQIAWSPDAKSIAFTYGAAGGADGRPANPAHLQRPTPVRVMLVHAIGDPTIITIGEARGPLFTRDGKALLFVRDGQIWTACLQDCHPERSEGPASQASPPLLAHQLVYDRGTASSPTLSPDGNTLAFISSRREFNQPSHTLLALFDMKTRTLTFPAPSTGVDSAPAFSPDGRQLAWIRSPFTNVPEFANPRTSALPWSIQLLNLADGKTRTLYSPAASKPGSVLPDPGGHDPYLLWTADNRVVFYSNNEGWTHLYSMATTGDAAPVLLTPGEYEVESATMDSGHHVVAWESNALDSDRTHIWQMNVTYPGEAPKQRTKGEGIEAHPAFSHDALAALASDTRTPMQPVGIGLQGQVDPLRKAAGSVGTSFVVPKQVLFDSPDGVHLHGQLFLPKQKAGPSPFDKLRAQDDNGKRPALIFVHGGPMRQMLLGFPAMDYYSNAYAMNQYLTSRGFIVLSVNYRCGIGYGVEFHQCQNAGAAGATEYNDVLAAQKYLASREDVDVKRIGIWGGSYGGYLTALALARNSDLFAAGVDFHGVHDWNLEDNASDWKRGSFTQQDTIAAKALQSSPLADLSRWHSPILLIHGDNDPSVAYAQTPILADALRARNASLSKDQQVDVEELVFPDEIHEFALHKDWVTSYKATAAFFERILQPKPVK